ncbi:probable G-protein coupled receptor 148 [Heterodontus francisci]|uniref:probable G-protein coupled receptor 148 n=1 Tax=Heterodontus francisci TaxID=7792 RepID=UPI00355B9346
MNLSKCENCNYYNEMSALGQEIVTVQFSTTASHPSELRILYNMVQECFLNMPQWGRDGLVIPLVFCLFASLLATPLVLLAIFSNNNLRQETRYLLLANTLFNDLIYSILTTFIAYLNAADIGMPKIVCETLLFLLTVAYCNGILTITATVVDTYVAISWPLRYTSLLPRSRTIKIIACIWILSVSSSSVLFIITLWTQENPSSRLLVCAVPLVLLSSPLGTFLLKTAYIFAILYFLICLILISSFYVMLYCKTRTSGIWVSNSRARQTYLIHLVLLIVYFSPLALLVAEGVLFGMHLIGRQSAVWIIVAVNNILMLPKAVLPYVYGLRYRDIANTIRSFFILKSTAQVRPLQVST